jgi:succinate dehydrogenase hydrophobic anchor subunit
MPNKSSSKIEQALKLDYKAEKDNIWLTSQNALRKLIGILGICLPVLLFLVLWIDAAYASPLFSISHYYFTRASGVFVIIVSLLAIFLLIYKGKEPIDFYLSSAAGLFALCLLIFPTDNISNKCNDENYLYSLTILHESKFRPVFHYISAAIFLSCLAYMSLFIFTKSNKSPELRGRQKRRRNRIFRTCGTIMVLALLVILANPLGIISNDTFEKYHLMFWMETIAVESFGVSWLVKAEVILKG